MNIEIKRDYYLNKLLSSRHNGLVKIITGIRRCGKSYLLRTIFKNYLLNEGIKQDHIIEMSFDLYENIKFQDPAVFYPWVLNKIIDNDKYYILLDEVQLLTEFVSVLNGLADRKNLDVYITGSNAKFLSKDICTEFGGRSDEIQMFPLSFNEFMSVYNGNYYDGLNEYITYGGIPIVVLSDSIEHKMNILKNLFTETYISDIKIRNKIKNTTEIDELLDILSSSIGSLINPNKLSNTFHSVKKSNITATTITKYLEYLEDAFLIQKAKRYDIKGKAYICTPQKYYFTDLGLRNERIEYRQIEVSHSFENLIYNELKIRGYNVDVGNLNITELDKNKNLVKKQLEVDFVCTKGSKKYYIQSSYLIETKEKERQEIRPFLKINDSFKKILITSNTPTPFYTNEGILIMSIYDFLKNINSLDF